MGDIWGGYNGRVEVIQQLVTALDEDYLHGLGLSALVASALSGGIYSSASAYLWSELARAFDTEASPPGRALFGNMRHLHGLALQGRQSLPPDGAFRETRRNRVRQFLA